MCVPVYCLAVQYSTPPSQIGSNGSQIIRRVLSKTCTKHSQHFDLCHVHWLLPWQLIRAAQVGLARLSRLNRPAHLEQVELFIIVPGDAQWGGWLHAVVHPSYTGIKTPNIPLFISSERTNHTLSCHVVFNTTCGAAPKISTVTG